MKKVSLIIVIILVAMQLRSQTIHFISALGTDSSIYNNIILDSSYNINHVKWILPVKNELLKSYCQRLIDENLISENDILIGTSFGGIVATEIGKLNTLKKIILVSSISTCYEKPPKFKFLKLFRFNKLIPKSMLNNPRVIIRSCFGHVTKNERAYLSSMISKYDVNLVYWSINQIMKYDNKITFQNVVKINGNNDKTFPSKYIQTDYLLVGSHLMVYANAIEVSKVINKILIADFNNSVQYFVMNEEIELINPIK